ncbi:diaminopimelate decarboxylase [Salegentibacter echinorum]|uniref:Diaminopimelate decarboxylase n=1 Tax=Salegentibacter echinorum TaxID=1073325 RepID=A0A1M5KE43_SALEC|nr:diaminopimelate decarboxylase [Salegentibacter echinorum]SHG50749.1 diaminopimelate decarboxylase [Salegentibacter echinorum]
MNKNTTYTKGNPQGGLSPITSKWMHSIFNDEALLNDLFGKYGSPINIHHLPTFSTNIKKYQYLFNDYGLRHQIFYARKANKCKSLVKQAFASGIGVDTASFRELEQSLNLGAPGRNLVLTAAIKTQDQYELAIKNQVPIILDNLDECEQANVFARKLGKKAIVGFRVSGFTVEDEKLYSRFGFDITQVSTFILENVGEGKRFEHLCVDGIHFHLDGYSTLQRGKALSDSISLTEQLNDKGFQIKFIDIGGGILMNYLQDEQQWKDFDAQLREQVSSGKGNLTFNNNGLGYEKIEGKVVRTLKTYPYYNSLNGTDFLKAILDYKDLKSGRSNAERLKKHQLEIRIEPGRSLLNQVGMTVARVAHRKQDYKGQWLVGLEMNMSQMMSSSSDFLLDPFIIYRKKAGAGLPVDVFFTGAYCLERDLLLKRKISLPQLPQPGDYVAFVNTAGYMMHFFETEAHLFELSKNLSFDASEDFSSEEFINDENISEN